MADLTVNYTGLIPGQVETQTGVVELNAGRDTVMLSVENVGDRPVQVGSHYHFFEVNEALQFDREMCLGYRLNIPAGTATRFEPGQARTVELVKYAGNLEVFGFQGKVMGKLI